MEGARSDQPEVRRARARGHGLLAARLTLALAAAALLLGPPPATGAEDRSVEYGVKAVFLERFARFVEWPAEALGDPAAPFRIEVLGDDPFAGLLEKAYATRPIRGRPVRIRHVARAAEVGPCHLLFISSSAAGQLDAVLARLEQRPILLVGDTRGFAEAGVHLNFYLEADKVRFELNPAALRRAGLNVSYLLQQVARTVEPREGGR